MPDQFGRPGRRADLARLLHATLIEHGTAPLDGAARAMIDEKVEQVANELGISEAAALKQLDDHLVIALATNTAHHWHAAHLADEAAEKLAVTVPAADTAQFVQVRGGLSRSGRSPRDGLSADFPHTLGPSLHPPTHRPAEGQEGRPAGRVSSPGSVGAQRHHRPMSNEDVEREVARRVVGYQNALSETRAELAEHKARAAVLERELAQARRGGGYGAHQCPTQEQVQAAMRSRDDAFQALAEVKERHQPRDTKFCRCGLVSRECRDQQLVLHYPAFKKWEEDHPHPATR